MESRLEDTLNGGYGGLYGEVVTCDTYRLKSVPFQPDLVFDIGANVGVFSRFARELFPAARIAAVEPHPPNCEVFRQFTPDKNTFLMECALVAPGSGLLFHTLTAVNGSGENYLSPCMGYPEDELSRRVVLGADMEVAGIPGLTLVEIFNTHWKPGLRTIMKIDCEGAENVLWQDPEAMAVLRRMDYLCMELHDYALTAVAREEVVKVTQAALESLEATHTCERDGVHFWATKRIW